MEIQSIHILRRSSDGALLGVLNQPDEEFLAAGAEVVASAQRPTNIHGMDDVSLALMLADLSAACIEWARQNPDKRAFSQ